ncbi:hypothetical protein TSOC_008732 [Tetrabaena socialis]|uniref:Uncharacterized protein n=1 Tax=Tetrabaena socialis TaxID=47790 RepID=A0A2J7ZXQ0_9CHLO|nr:hypothetical protein TSOC_008732 [Tetrabaena socialis]|eukprot:PNH05041.1 hypothetical protein TSOC_008732 [Tetrabaena socialis]
MPIADSGCCQGGRCVYACRGVRLQCSATSEPRDQPEGGDRGQRPQHPELDDSGPSSSDTGIPDTLPFMGSQADWREFRAKLVSQGKGQGQAGPSTSGEWAHAISKPEKGAVLLAHPLMFRQSQPYFHRAVILLLEHGDSGSYGLILNRPSKLRIGDVPLNRPQTQFADCRLYVGGDVGSGQVQVMHPHGELEGVEEVMKGVYLGGMDSARDAVEAGRAEAKDFRWFSAYAGWAAGQLAAECKRGVWFTAAASPKVVLQEVALEEGADYWHKLLELMGGDYQGLSQAVKKHDSHDADADPTAA